MSSTSADLVLNPSCSGCASTSELYGSNCKHLTLCLSCGKSMAEKRAKCFQCGAIVTRLIREYSVRPSTVNEKNYFIGRFVTGLPSFSKKKNAENKWSLHKEGLQGRQLTDTLREKFKNKPWVLEDETGQFQYQGQLEGAQTATYYLLMLQGKEFSAIPAGSWFNFNKVAQYKQLTLEEAEEKIKNRKKTADGYERWMMKAANNGAAAFGEVERFDKDGGANGGGRGGRKKAGEDDDEGNASDKGEEDEEEEFARKNRLNKKGGGDDDEDEGARGGDADMDDDDIEKGDDWEHEEIFTDDDEAVGNNAEEREDLETELPAPPEIKQDDEDEDEDDKEGGLSKSGKELKKLLGRTGGLNDSDAEDDDDDDDDEDMDDDITFPQALPPKQKDAPKAEPSDNSPSKPASGSARGTPSSTSKSAKGKRKLNGDDAKASNNAPPKKVKSENEQKPSVKDDPASASKNSAPTKRSPSVKPEPASAGVPVTEEEIRAVLIQRAPVTTQDLVAKFKGRLKSKEDKTAFAEILRRISKIQKTNGSSFVVLR